MPQATTEGWPAEVTNEPHDSPLRHIAGGSKGIDEPPLRLAHCIRDLAYGEESRADDLVAMVNSDDPGYRKMFEECLWRSTLEDKGKVEMIPGTDSRRRINRD